MHSRVCFYSYCAVLGPCLSLAKPPAESADVEADFAMHLGRSGEAYFVGEDDIVGMSPCLQGSLHCHTQCNCHVSTIILSICMQCPYRNCQTCHVLCGWVPKQNHILAQSTYETTCPHCEHCCCDQLVCEIQETLMMMRGSCWRA